MYERSPQYYGILVYLLFIVSTGIFFTVDVSSKTVNPDFLQNPAASTLRGDIMQDISCSDYLLKVSEDDVRYVREAGGGTLFAASTNGKIGFYVLERNHMIPAASTDVDRDTARRLEQALSECHGIYMRAGTYFDPFYDGKNNGQIAKQDIADTSEKPQGRSVAINAAVVNPSTAADPGKNGEVDQPIVARVQKNDATVAAALEADTNRPEATNEVDAVLTGGDRAPEVPASFETAEVVALQSTHIVAEVNTGLKSSDRAPEVPAYFEAAEEPELQNTLTVAEANKPASSDAGQTWNINIASLTNRANADRFLEHARDKGIEATQTQVTVNGNKYWRVSVKGFISPDEAKSSSIGIKERLGLKEVWISKDSIRARTTDTAHNSGGPPAG